MVTDDMFPAELAVAQAEYCAPPPTQALCEVDGCGAPALPFSTLCVDCDELPDEYYEYGELPRERDPVPPSAFFDYANQR